jgi:propionyl-CoA carboxylase alpha chain
MGMICVAVYTDADQDAPHVSDADLALRLDGTNGYLDADALIEAARASGAEAVHPGYGFLSENAAFARAVEAAGLIWVGPSPAAIESMGDKVEAKRHAMSAGVPVLASTEDPAEAEAVGFPILVKATAGGGGKGMRVVSESAELDEAIASARREAQSGFGDDRVFLERYVAASRHVEVQILGDRHGNLVHLGERECSIQRRHQKLVEESPSPVVDADLRSRMGDAALTLARIMGYSSTGTVEFLVDDTTREFFFLEVNTRLQVEHPVTEMVTGIDLVRQQLLVAQGFPLAFAADDVAFDGHAIEARLCAEDPAGGFLPATGTLEVFAPADEPAVRWDSGVETGSVVTVAFDPMLAKVIAHGPTRVEAAGRLARALERLHLGGVVTNRDFLVSVLRSPAFLAGDTTTDFIERTSPALGPELEANELERVAITAVLARQVANRRAARVWRELPGGWRNARLPDERVTVTIAGEELVVTYRALRDGTFLVNGALRARIFSSGDDRIDLDLDGVRRNTTVTMGDGVAYVQDDRGTVTVRFVPRFSVPGLELPAGGLVAPMPGVVIDVRVAVGDVVSAGQTVVVMEAMKMEQRVSAPADGIVTEVYVTTGQQVENGAALLQVISEEDPTGQGAAS